MMQHKLFNALLVFAILAMALSLAPVSGVQAAGPWYVRIDGNDTSCNGTVNAAYSTTVAPACAYQTIHHAITSAASGDTINVAAGTYVEDGQIVISKNLTLTGANRDATVIMTNTNTTSTGDAQGWILVDPGITFNLANFTLDGSQQIAGQYYDIYQAIRSHGSGSITNVRFQFITAPGNMGTAVALVNGSMNISSSRFNTIGWAGVMVSGSGTTASIQNNIFTGLGTGTVLDYGVYLESSAVATVSGNVINNYRGAASGATSAGILLSTASGASTQATILSNSLVYNATGVQVGLSNTDISLASMHFNHFFGNGTGVVNSTATAVDATNNWWGCNAGPGATGCDTVTGDVTFNPWLVLSAGTNPAPIQPFAQTTISANLVMNSAGDNTSADGNVPVDTLATFSAPDGGSVSPTSAAAVKGAFATTFTAPGPAQVYRVCAAVDNSSACNNVTVVNVAPVANADAYDVNWNNTFSVSAAQGVLKNDTDANGDTLTAVLNSTTSHGTLTLAPDGSFTYIPTTGYKGPDSFTYHASDGSSVSNTVTVTLTVGVFQTYLYLPVIFH